MLAQLGETDARLDLLVDQQAARQAEADLVTVGGTGGARDDLVTVGGDDDVPKPDDFQLQLMLEEAGFTKEDLDYINDWQLDPG